MDSYAIPLELLRSIFSTSSEFGLVGWGYLLVLSIVFVTFDRERKDTMDGLFNLVAFWGISAMVASIVLGTISLPLLGLSAIGFLTDNFVGRAIFWFSAFLMFSTPLAVLRKWSD